MRARSLKPSIFKNELLAVADPLYTVIFEGLWCAADREGRLEDRPAKLHMEINPGRAFDGTDKSIAWLSDNGFILRYAVNGIRYIQILSFAKHQKPHVNEKPSVIPAPESTTKVASEHNQGEKHLALTPDSGLLTPDSSLRESTAAAPPNAPRETEGWFLDFKLAYPDRAGDQGWRKALRAANARIAEGHKPEEFIEGAKRYAVFVAAKGDTGTEFVKQAATFLGPDKPFLLPWKPPPDKNQQRQDANVSESLKWLESSNAA